MELVEVSGCLWGSVSVGESDVGGLVGVSGCQWVLVGDSESEGVGGCQWMSVGVGWCQRWKFWFIIVYFKSR